MGRLAESRLLRFVLPRLAFCVLAAGVLLVTFGVRPRFFSTGPSSPGPASATPAETESTNAWPHLRGPAGNSISGETDLADTWPPEGPPVLWSREIGTGYSGIIVVGNRAYTQTQRLYGQYVLALDAETGRTLWEHRYAWPYEPGGMYPGPRATPTWSDGKVYYAAPDGKVGCLDAETGVPDWTADLDERFGLGGTGFGYSCSPAVEDDKVVFPVGAKGASVVALNTTDGSTVWAAGDHPVSYSSAKIVTLNGRRIVVVLLHGALTLIDLHSGELLQEWTALQAHEGHATMPLYQEPFLVLTSPFRAGAEVLRIVEDSDSLVKLRRHISIRKMSNDVASSLLLDGTVYGFDLRDISSKPRRPSRGTFRAIDLETGDVLWSDDGPGHTSLLGADGKLFMLNDRGEVILARASREKYEELGRINLFGDEICWTAPALSNRRLFVRSPTKAACLYVGRPEELGAKRKKRARTASEITKTKRWNLRWVVGAEREYPFDPPDMAELTRWYICSLVGVLVPSCVLSLVSWLVLLRKRDLARKTAGILFWTALLLLGVVATPLFNHSVREFIFTWPVTLFAAQQVLLNTVAGAGREASSPRQFRMFAAVAFFFAVCTAYFHFCQRLDLAMQWAFLIGFLPSWVVAVPFAYRLRGGASPFVHYACGFAAFSAYFWATAAFIAWRMTL